MDSQETRIYIAIIICCIVVGIIVGYFVWSIIRQQKRNYQLHKENILAEISAMEKERSRIAADLHDDLGPVLSATKYILNNTEAVDPTLSRRLEKASGYIDDTINRIRKIAKNLMPISLESKGLVAAIDEFLLTLQENSDIRIEFTYDELPELNKDQKINLFRVVQEVLHNTIKHSKATDVYIHLGTYNDNITLNFKDNGIGFDYITALRESKGIGLRSLKSRTEIMGGNLTVDSKISSGTLQKFEFPFIENNSPT
jgi:signal transduction histidine kinase